MKFSGKGKKMDTEELRQEAARRIFELYPPDRQGRGFICPLCGNGSGNTGDGVTFVKNSYRVHCFKCGFSGDIISLKARENNCSYSDAANALAYILGMVTDKDKHFVKKKLLTEGTFKLRADYQNEKLPQIFSPNMIEEVKVDYSQFISDAEKNLEFTNYHLKRGLSWETAHHFHLGYVKNWNHPKIPNVPSSPRLIIPNGKYGYLARDVRIDLSEKQKKYSKQKVGSSLLFNVDALNSELVFIVEGEFDAMSFHEIGFAAVSLGSISNYNKLIDTLLEKNNFPAIIILALDNDKGGKSTTRKLHMILDNIGFYNFIASDIYGEFKDANDALADNREKFSTAVKKNVETARKKFLNKITVL